MDKTCVSEATTWSKKFLVIILHIRFEYNNIKQATVCKMSFINDFLPYTLSCFTQQFCYSHSYEIHHNLFGNKSYRGLSCKNDKILLKSNEPFPG